MKKKSNIILMILAFSFLLFGCGSKQSQEPALNPISSSMPSDTENMEAPETDSSVSDVSPTEGMVRSRITNEWISDDLYNQRPIAVMIPNTKTSSQYGISDADILYECNVESNITRLMGIYENWNDIEKIGNIRSSRDYFMYWSYEWDAFLVHYGGPFYMDNLINRNDTENINLNLDVSKTYHFRSIAKNDFDNAFTSSELIKNYISDSGYSTNYRDGYCDEQHFLFASDENPNMLTQYENTISAQVIDMSLAYPLTNCYFIYNEETGLYDRYQHLSGDSDGPHIDLANNEQLSFKNILVQNTYYEIRDQKGYLAFQCHDTTRDGWFFTNGKGIHVNWKKKSDYGATRYYDDDGNEIELNTGKTMICILEDGDIFNVDDKLIESN